MSANESHLPDGYSNHLCSLTETLTSLRETIEGDHTLTTDQRMFARRLLYLTNSPSKRPNGFFLTQIVTMTRPTTIH